MELLPDLAKWRQARAAYGPDVLAMDVADMDISAPTEIVQAVMKRAATGLFGYVEFPAQTAKIIAAYLARQHQWQVEAEHIVFTQRVMEAFGHVLKIVTTKGDGVIVPSPSYGPITRLIEPNRRRLDTVPLAFDGNRYTLDLAAIDRAFQAGARALLLINPHNPTGRCWTEEELRALARVCAAHQAWIISDDVHADLVYHPNRYTPIANFYQQVLTFHSPAKAYNVAGLETAYAVIPDKKLRQTLQNRLHTAGMHNPPFFTAVAIETAYESCQQWLTDLQKRLVENRDLVRRCLPAGASLIEPEATYLAWLDLRKWGSEASLINRICRRGQLALSPGSSFGPGNDGFMRMSLAVEPDTLNDALRRLNSVTPERNPCCDQ